MWEFEMEAEEIALGVALRTEGASPEEGGEIRGRLGWGGLLGLGRGDIKVAGELRE